MRHSLYAFVFTLTMNLPASIAQATVNDELSLLWATLEYCSDFLRSKQPPEEDFQNEESQQADDYVCLIAMPGTTPDQMTEILKKAHAFKDNLYKEKVYRAYIQRPDANEETITALIKEAGNFRDILYKVSLYKTCLDRKETSDQLRILILKSCKYLDDEYKRFIETAYPGNSGTDQAALMWATLHPQTE